MSLSIRLILFVRSLKDFDSFKFKTFATAIEYSIDIEVSCESCNIRLEPPFVSSSVPPFFFHLTLQAGAPRPTPSSPKFDAGRIIIATSQSLSKITYELMGP